MNKVVYNRCYGGFGLSRAATQSLANMGVEEAAQYIHDFAQIGYSEVRFSFTPRSLPRHDPRLVKVVEDLGRQVVSADCAELDVYEIDSRLYRIEERDGMEEVIEGGSDWTIVD